MASPTVHTYHCPCTSLLIASTHTLSALPRRAPPSLDKAIILPLPSSATPPLDTNELSPLGYTSLLSMAPDHRATIVRREDGFEKRYLWRCGRCRIVVGYELDPEHYENVQFDEGQGAESGDVSAEGRRERTKTLYVLPGWIMSTEQMAAGKKIEEGEAVLQPGQRATAAYE